MRRGWGRRSGGGGEFERTHSSKTKSRSVEEEVLRG